MAPHRRTGQRQTRTSPRRTNNPYSSANTARRQRQRDNENARQEREQGQRQDQNQNEDRLPEQEPALPLHNRQVLCAGPPVSIHVAKQFRPKTSRECIESYAVSNGPNARSRSGRGGGRSAEVLARAVKSERADFIHDGRRVLPTMHQVFTAKHIQILLGPPSKDGLEWIRSREDREWYLERANEAGEVRYELETYEERLRRFRDNEEEEEEEQSNDDSEDSQLMKGQPDVLQNKIIVDSNLEGIMAEQDDD